MADNYRCFYCKACNNCGWSNVMPQPKINPEILTYEPCENLCAPIHFTTHNCTDDGLVRVFEAAALREQNDKARNRGERARPSTMIRHERSKRRR